MSKSILISATVKNLSFFANKRKAQNIFRTALSATTVTQLVSNIREITNLVDCSDYEPGKDLIECQNKIKGDLFEVFAAFWLDSFRGRFYISDLDWTRRDMKGIDFMAKNRNGNPVTIQVKYVGDPKSIFAGDGRLETFFQESIKYTIASDSGKVPMTILFTSAAKVGGRYKNDRSNTLLVLDKEMLSKHTKDNKGFWIDLEKKSSLIFQG